MDGNARGQMGVGTVTIKMFWVFLIVKFFSTLKSIQKLCLCVSIKWKKLTSSGRLRALKTDEAVKITVHSVGPITRTPNVKLYATAELQLRTQSSNSG